SMGGDYILLSNRAVLLEGAFALDGGRYDLNYPVYLSPDIIACKSYQVTSLSYTESWMTMLMFVF
ncbi:MAG: hypothetical protein WBD28_04200, partial [Candidatus Zixiibacteriota bacterium]